ncbi:glycosyltransferase [Patescibacteria group bacterium]|nr:glycosyltransferase [Patescibacteria group bacterium]
MKNILKVGDSTYALSLQNFSKSYLSGFPQREQHLIKHCKNVKFNLFRHKLLNDVETIIKEREKLNSFLEDGEFDYVMIDNPLSMLIVEKDHEIPIIFDCIDWYDEMYLREFGINKRYYLLRYGFLEALEKVDKVICQSPVILDSLRKWGLKTKKVAIIPNGYDTRLFYPYAKKKIKKLKSEFENKYKISTTDKTLIVYTGKVGTWYDQLITISETIDESQIFIIVGDGPLLKDIPKKENIIKCSAVKLHEVPNYTNISDVLVFPVSEDCSPIAISEYLAVGKPIVVPYGRIRWLLKDKINAFFVEKTIPGWKNGIQLASKEGSKIKRNNIKLAQKLSWQLLSRQFYDFIS